VDITELKNAEQSVQESEEKHRLLLNSTAEAGAGATFDIYLPRIDGKAPPLAPELEMRSELPRGTETILFLEDEDALRQVTCEFLKASGYQFFTSRPWYSGL
jgi:hypothetical protein